MEMSFCRWGSLACAIMLLASQGVAPAAEQVELGKVSTSVGVAPTSAANKFKLITDPVVTGNDEEGADPSDYIPTEGYLNSHFDTSQFTLNTDPNTGKFSLASTVMGVLPFQVLGFEVQTVDGGLIDVQDNGEGGDTYSDITNGPLDPTDGPVGGAPNGNVYDIHFKIINDEQGSAMPSNMDQDFYALFLTQIGNDPYQGDDTTFVNNFPGDSADTSSVTFNPINPASGLPTITVFPPDINNSVVPEVSTASFLAMGGIAAFMRRRRGRNNALPVAEPQTPPNQA